MSDKIAQPIEYILKSQLGPVLSKAFAELYRTKPNFPVTHLAKWLHQYSQVQQTNKNKTQTVHKNLQQYIKHQQQLKNIHQAQNHKNKQQQQNINQSERMFMDTVAETEYLEDLLEKWLPNFVERRYCLSGAYVGQLTHPYRVVQAGNFQAGAEIDAESPKIIEYIGASDSQQKIMKMKVLPNQQGVSFDCFIEPQPEPEQAEPAQGQEPKPPKQPKKTYIFIPDVTKNEKVFYFKFPRLGSYACFPLKLKSLLIQSAFDQGINDYKQYVKQKQEAEKEYNQKLNQMKNQYEQAKKKYQQFQVPEQEPTPEQIQQKKNLQLQANRLHEALLQYEKNTPKVPEPKYNFLQKCYMLGCDNLGQDKQISQATLDQIDKKTLYFKQEFQRKQKQMLLHDILIFIEQEPKLQSIEVLYREHEKKAAAESQEQAKEKNLKDKELQFDIAATKVKKMDAVFEQPNMQKSMNTYFNYNTPKFKQILQIALMFLGYKSSQINLSRKNVLDFRKVKKPAFIQQFMKRLSQFDVRPLKAEPCAEQYKINKLLERLQKIDLEQLAKYNGFIWALANHIKSYCWALILCRDAKKEAYQISVKNKQDRNAQIEKYMEERQKAMNGAKAQLGEQNQATFNQEEWIANYIVESPEPQPLQAITLQQYHNID